jgi:phosphohistidine phosphatase
MDLILWRHAEAEDLGVGDDLQRSLTRRGDKQAARMGDWLRHHLPDDARILCSPARRCEQTVRPLRRHYLLAEELAPGASVDEVLGLAQWPGDGETVVVVGHQPTLGAVIARLLQMRGGDCTVRKGAVWWLRTRASEGHRQASVVAVQSPDLL